MTVETIFVVVVFSFGNVDEPLSMTCVIVAMRALVAKSSAVFSYVIPLINDAMFTVETPATLVKTTVAVLPDTVTLYVIPFVVVVPVPFTKLIVVPSRLIFSETPFAKPLTVKVRDVMFCPVSMVDKLAPLNNGIAAPFSVNVPLTPNEVKVGA